MLVAIVGAATAVLQGYTQLGDRVQSFGEQMLTSDTRIPILEMQFQKRDGEGTTLTFRNALQVDRMRNTALEQERQAKAESKADLRRSAAVTRVQIGDFNRALSEFRAGLRMLVYRVRRSRTELPPPQRDAQVEP